MARCADVGGEPICTLGCETEDDCDVRSQLTCVDAHCAPNTNTDAGREPDGGSGPGDSNSAGNNDGSSGSNGSSGSSSRGGNGGVGNDGSSGSNHRGGNSGMSTGGNGAELPDDDTPLADCVGPDTPEGALGCDASLPCSCSNEREWRCAETPEGTQVGFQCLDGEWLVQPHGRCAPESVDCFSPTENVTLASTGTLPGCPCDDRDGEEPFETCARAEGVQVPMWCDDGQWAAEPTEFGCSLAWDLCSGSCPETLSEVDTRVDTRALEENTWLVEGEPGCYDDCAYVFHEYLEAVDDSAWVHTMDVQCPLNRAACPTLVEEFYSVSVVCDVDEDCTLLDGWADCENEFQPPPYLDSVLLSPAERESRAEIWSRIVAAGCGDETGYDGAISEAGCVDGVCRMRETEVYCGMALEEDSGSGTR